MSDAINQPSVEGSSLAGPRRDFLKTGVATGVAALLGSQAAISHGAHAAGSGIVKVGLIGCGGRGTDATRQAMKADKNARLVAMADAFADHIDRRYKELKDGPVGEQIEVDNDHRFVGFDAYKHVVDTCDVVLLTSPPHFRPHHVKYAVEKGKHVFAEKPVAVDATGVRSIIASCEEAARRGVSVVSGLCWRYHEGVKETIEKVHNGGIGDIVAMQCTYHTGELWQRPMQPTWSEMEYQVRNWLYYTWLSGDFIAEQHIHSIDKILWAMKDVPPVKCTGVGGRQVRTDPKFGHVYDHFSCVFEWENGVKGFSSCRQMDGCTSDVSDHLFGSKGTCNVQGMTIKGETPYSYTGKNRTLGHAYQEEHNVLFASVRDGKPVNNGLYSAYSTLMTIMGRMSAYTGRSITWKEALESNEDLSPAKYEWGPLSTPAVAMPGKKRELAAK